MTKFMNLLLATVLASALLLTGCGGGESDQDHDDTDAHSDDDGHGHGDSHGYDHGSAVEQGLGEITIAGSVFSVSVGGEPGPNAAIHVDFELKSGPPPSAIRVWVGEASAIGSVKGKAMGTSGDYHADVTCPAKLAEDSELWIEIESTDGTRTAGSLKFDHDDE